MLLEMVAAVLALTGSATGISVTCPGKRYVVMLFQPVTIPCQFQTSATSPPLITWKYKSYCQDPISLALNPSSVDNTLAQNNPNYNPVNDCPDNSRTVRIVASKQMAVALGPDYQGRKISIVNDADLNIVQTAWGDSGVYYCSVSSSQDLSGNGECFSELIVLERKSNTTDLLPGFELLVMEDKLLVVLVVLGFLLVLLLIGICWCQCCPHTCCCLVSCPCCPERCCCPRALYEAGKAVKSGIPSHYAPTVYTPNMYAQSAYGMGGPSPAIPMLPIPQGVGMAPSNGYGRDYDSASSVGQGSQVPLLQDHDMGGGQTRSGYRIQANPDGNPTRVMYYMERELANLDPSRPGDAAVDGMSEVSSLHDAPDPRTRGRSRPPQLNTLYDDVEENMSTISSVSQHAARARDDRYRRGDGPPQTNMAARGRTRSMDDLDDLSRRYPDRDDDYREGRRYDDRGRGGGRSSDDEWSSSGRAGYERNRDDRRPRDYSPDGLRRRESHRGAGFMGRRSRSRDDLTDLEHNRDRRDAYDDSFLREALERKKLGEQSRGRSRERLDSDSNRSKASSARGVPPLPLVPPSGHPDYHGYGKQAPPSYSDNESVPSSKKSNLRKNGAVSRESLVV
ncbi:lipolysis-stimulated lipoprotein receptor isoform X2 [Denticeps clupeoides]|uniref:lipolysis-stimulated lipoprotein receptor isoform X2 n=1 Tax=Denticeps clupeoides TaxID=299321 RepID=UPI0010A3686C|nr:lipolysis-stimulated lipoprotein receptor-like isoform X2 [Denticeps clupeoides]